MGQSGAVDTLGAEHVGVVDVGNVFWGERLGRTCHHVSGVVNDDVEAPVFFDDRCDGGVNRVLRRDVHLDRLQLYVAGRGIPAELCHRIGVSASGVADAGVDVVPRVGESPGGECPEPARRSGENDDLTHGSAPWRSLETT
jgi:hypothetical protein